MQRPDLRIAAAVQARMGSSRLPGKALLDLNGEPILYRIVEQLRGVAALHQVVVTTTPDPADDALAQFAAERGLLCYRGPVDDILGRLGGAADVANTDVLIRVWGDCPFICPDVVERMLRTLIEQDLLFITNAEPDTRSYPPGLDIEIYRRSLLEQIASDVTNPFFREFPVDYVSSRKSELRSAVFREGADHAHVHLTVDYPEDLEAARELHARLYQRGQPFRFDALMRMLSEQPHLLDQFAKRERNRDYFAKRQSQKSSA